MKSLTVTMLSLSIIIILTGCSPVKENTSAGNEFPPCLAGAWQAEDQAWKIVLTDQGIVESVLLPLGGVEVTPNQTTTLKMKDGNTSVYTAGDMTVGYDPEQRMLSLSVEMERIEIKYHNEVIEGHSIDIFEGILSENCEQWTPKWISMFDYGERFPQSESDVQEVPLVFKKIEISADE